VDHISHLVYLLVIHTSTGFSPQHAVNTGVHRVSLPCFTRLITRPGPRDAVRPKPQAVLLMVILGALWYADGHSCPRSRRPSDIVPQIAPDLPS